MVGSDKKSDIMRAAEKLIRERDFHEVTLDEVAQLAQVGKGTIYRFFRDKEDLFFQTACSGFDDMCDLIEKDSQLNNDFSEKILKACNRITCFFKNRKQLFRMMQMEEGRVIWSKSPLWKQWLSRHQRMVNALAVILEQGVGEKQVRSDIRRDVMSVFLLGMLRTRARYLSDETDSVKSMKLLLNIFIHGISTCSENTIK